MGASMGKKAGAGREMSKLLRWNGLVGVSFVIVCVGVERGLD